jgi:hypothetical protein
MRTTTTVLAVGATALAIPSSAHGAHAEHPDLRAPLAGHTTVGSQMRAERRELTQDKRAAMLYAREGASPWPVCGR